MKQKLLNIFIGYEPAESIAWHTMAHSIFSQASIPVAIIPVNIANLKNIYSRVKDLRQSNEFSYSRFLVPFLSEYKGYSIFFDCDMMVRCDIKEILKVIDSEPDKAVYVVKHNYEPKDKIKYLNNVQYSYPRKNWSSVVLWNNSHPSNSIVTPSFVNEATPKILHRFEWLKDEEIGELDIRWNWLVGEYEQPPIDVKNVHWTVGGPYFKEYENVDFSKEWIKLKEEIIYCAQRKN